MLDPKVLEAVRELDEKHGDILRKPKETVLEADISGFNVLLNACKPSILETRPQMRLNVVKELDKRIDSAGPPSSTTETTRIYR